MKLIVLIVVLNFCRSDIDECLKSENQCPGPCINTPGSFKCDCNVTGFTASGSPDYCNDIDECAENNGGCDNVCVNRRGFYQCRCEIKGRQLSDNGHSCIDIDECERYNLKVCSNGRCVNNEGSYTCKCKEGYKAAMNDSVCEDIDECLKDNGGCSHVCSNAAGSFSCSCHEGYFVHDDSFGCVDIDECLSKNGGCEDTCKNTIGSFLCSCEMDGKILSSDGRTCSACASNQYYDNSLSQCVDCPPFSKVNSKKARGVHDCQCLDGFDQSEVKDDVSFECLDKDECLLQEFRCAFKCINTPGSAHCICPKGFFLATDEQSCEDIDECQSINDCAHICENTNGSYICHCNSGFSLEADGITCTDIEECDVDPALCPHTCVNTMGSYRCECDDGFVLRKNGMNCEDIDECADENPRCEHKCVNTDGSYRCECDGNGFKLSKDHTSCIDINECMEGDNPCPDICINTIGSFLCDCNSTGYLLGPDQTNCIDVDECSRDPSPCQHSVCINTPGSYICKCRRGFEHPSRNNLTTCIACEIGFYRSKKDKQCVRCPPKSTTPGVGSIGKDQCECMPGFKGNTHEGDTCVDVNECADKLIRCEHGCVNTNGSAHCICRPGFHLHFDGFSCTDINECLMLNGGCDQKCVNSPGSYHCKCQRDFKLAENGRSCEDVNECASPNHGCEYRCVNKRGGAMCTCPPGYDLLRDGKKCHDRDECRTRNGGCTDTCINTPGSYHCECNIQGYELYTDGRSCIDVDECLKKDTCDDICVNVVGSFRCYCRRHGYKLAYDKRSCEDVDECTRGRICQQRCINIQGSFRCDCNAGYYKQGHHCTPCSKGQYRSIKDSVVSCLFCPDGMTTERAGSSSIRACHCQEGYHGNPETRDKCQDIDECARNNGGCEQVCENTVGSFKCSCSKGYDLDPETKKCKGTRCPLLNPPRYGRFITPACFKMARGRHVKPGITCVIKCRNLLILSGAKERTCLANYTWSQPDTKCTAFPCQRLPIPKNGFLHPPSCLLPRVPFRARCSFRCNNGFIRVGRPAAKCRANQRWSGIGRWGKCIPFTNSTSTPNPKKS